MIVLIINLAVRVIEALIFIRIILSWVMPGGGQNNEFGKFINDLTEPLLAPFRVVLPLGNMGGLDLSPIILLFILDIVRNFVVRML